VLTVGSVVAGYQIERVLGSGGMGSVCLAASPTLPRLDLSSDAQASTVAWPRHTSTPKCEGAPPRTVAKAETASCARGLI
jgi:hypothetical protein